MPRCDWLQLIALGRFLVVIPHFDGLLPQDNNYIYQQQTDPAGSAIQQAGPQLTPIPFDWKELTKTDWANPECDKPKDHDEADLCVQRQVEHTAEYSLRTTYFQIFLGIVGAGLLLWTLRYTRRAAGAAVVAANAARDSADALPNLERAYVFIEIAPDFEREVSAIIGKATLHNDMSWTVVKDCPTVRFQFINHGKTPAIITAMGADVQHWTDLPSPVNYVEEPMLQEIVVRAGDIYPPRNEIHVPAFYNEALNRPRGTIEYNYFQKAQALAEPLDLESVKSIQAGNGFLWFYGYVAYKDVFGRPHETRFCWRYHGPTNTFEQYNRGDEGLNRRT